METDNKAMNDAQRELVMAHEQLGAVNRSLTIAKTSLHKNEITKVELGKLTDNKVYKSVGRMFVLSDTVAVVKSIEAQNAKINEESTRYQNLKKTYEIKKESATKHLQDVLNADK